MSVLKGKNILLGVTGSIAAYKACEVVRLLRKSGASVRVIMTESATRFVGPTTFSALTGSEVLTDLFPGMPPPGEIHIDTAAWANALVIAPATANILAKAALGVADDLLSTVILASDAPILMAPAMNEGMWQKPATRANVRLLEDRDVTLLRPEYGPLADLTRGEGRMVEPSHIVAALRHLLGTTQDLKGKKVLVTAGPTREPIDAVRFLSNRSSGKMGYALAQAAIDRGATVTLITGPTRIDAPTGCTVVNVETADDMNEAVRMHCPGQDIIIMAAAVADFKPARPRKSKIPRSPEPSPLELRATPDIVKGIRPLTNAVVVGFALEVGKGREKALKKLGEKDLDAVILNYADRPESGFESDTNEGVLFFKDLKRGITLPLESKSRMAHRILSEVIRRIPDKRRRRA